MKGRLSTLSLRLAVAWFLLDLCALTLFLIGSLQTFLDRTLMDLFLQIRLSTWLGLLAAWFFLVPLSWNQGRRLVFALVISASFTVLFAFVLFWGIWVYPQLGNWPW